MICKAILLSLTAFLTALLGNARINAETRSATDKPNFVIIFIDDMGYGDIGPFGSTKNSTPNLDQMARQGRKFTSFYVASPVCTPSRAALLTGCYPQRVGLEKGSGHIVLFPGDHHGLHPNEITVAETLKEAGYATGLANGIWVTKNRFCQPLRDSTPILGFRTLTICGLSYVDSSVLYCPFSKMKK